ncbi:MAG: hypothetical protein COA86_17840 [Kangiella sp.]|nr:MAG: hypothetical protein COA86_17840 [Kangiella sp.]
MFVEPDFNAAIGNLKLSRPDQEEIWPEPSVPFYYVNSFKPHSEFIKQIYKFVKKSETKIGVFPVNVYAQGTRIDGPYLHPVDKLVTFTPRNESDHWIHPWEWLNSGQAFFVPLDASWVVYTSHSNNADSLDYLMADKKFFDEIKTAWPEMVNYVYRQQ